MEKKMTTGKWILLAILSICFIAAVWYVWPVVEGKTVIKVTNIESVGNGVVLRGDSGEIYGWSEQGHTFELGKTYEIVYNSRTHIITSYKLLDYPGVFPNG